VTTVVMLPSNLTKPVISTGGQSYGTVDLWTTTSLADSASVTFTVSASHGAQNRQGPGPSRHVRRRLGACRPRRGRRAAVCGQGARARRSRPRHVFRPTTAAQRAIGRPQSTHPGRARSAPQRTLGFVAKHPSGAVEGKPTHESERQRFSWP
jgi:hypothetical protein